MTCAQIQTYKHDMFVPLCFGPYSTCLLLLYFVHCYKHVTGNYSTPCCKALSNQSFVSKRQNLKTYSPLKLQLLTMAQLRFRYYKNLSNPAPPVSQLISLVIINHFTQGLKK